MLNTKEFGVPVDKMMRFTELLEFSSAAGSTMIPEVPIVPSGKVISLYDVSPQIVLHGPSIENEPFTYSFNPSARYASKALPRNATHHTH